MQVAQRHAGLVRGLHAAQRRWRAGPPEIAHQLAGRAVVAAAQAHRRFDSSWRCSTMPASGWCWPGGQRLARAWRPARLHRLRRRAESRPGQCPPPCRRWRCARCANTGSCRWSPRGRARWWRPPRCRRGTCRSCRRRGRWQRGAPACSRRRPAGVAGVAAPPRRSITPCGCSMRKPMENGLASMHAALVQHGKGVARAVAQGQHHMVGTQSIGLALAWSSTCSTALRTRPCGRLSISRSVTRCRSGSRRPAR
jgi:hypothetical protein